MFELDPQSAVPPFQQLRVEILEQVRSGELAAGARLPTVRSLAEELGLAANTVAKAYRMLEEDGILETRGRNGSFVSPQGDSRERKLQEAAAAYAASARRLNIPPAQAVRFVEAALRSDP
jgi:DNA-binding transcriptional regulator YhcF (GntR family)